MLFLRSRISLLHIYDNKAAWAIVFIDICMKTLYSVKISDFTITEYSLALMCSDIVFLLHLSHIFYILDILTDIYIKNHIICLQYIYPNWKKEREKIPPIRHCLQEIFIWQCPLYRCLVYKVLVNMYDKHQCVCFL